jgi:hypothetical protein
MCILDYTSDQRKILGYMNPILQNQLTLNPQINENNEKYKTMYKKKNVATKKKNSTKRKGIVH